jgi:RNA polymerase sigma-70 factor, ECF subfamily
VTGSEVLPDADRDLVRLALSGDEGAFEELVERNRRAVYRAAYAALGSAADADDVVQDAFVTAYQKLGTFRRESSFKTWLLSIAWRKALDRRKRMTRWLRMTRSRDQFGEESSLANEVPSPEPSHDAQLSCDELQRVLRQLVAALPRNLRDALLMTGSSEHSYDEIAKVLEIPVGTLKWRVSEARRLLKRKLAALGYVHD